MGKKVIIDLGAHEGEDSDFYLKKGFRVIAVDANKKLYEKISERFKEAIVENRFKIFNYAVTDKDNEQITFYENTDNSVWGTIFNDWDSRNKKFGTSSVKTTVDTVRLDSLLEREVGEDEILEYIKVDIEGADLLALKSLSNLKRKPRFVSLESEKISWDGLVEVRLSISRRSRSRGVLLLREKVIMSTIHLNLAVAVYSERSCRENG